MRIPLAPISLLLGLLLTACAPGRTLDKGSVLRGRPTSVEVTNNNWADVAVYALRDGSRQRLGMVVSMGTTVLRIPPVMVAGGNQLQLLVDPIGSSQVHVTEPFLLDVGQRVELRVQNHLATSSVSIWGL